MENSAERRNYVPIKFSYPENEKRLSHQAERSNQYPCLCQAIRSVCFWGRLLGIFPVAVAKGGSITTHATGCHLEVSKRWKMYSCFLQVAYAVYFCYSYGFRFVCGPLNNNYSEWYVMTFGYMVSDLDAMVTLTASTVTAKRNCELLEKFSKMPGPIGGMRKLQTHIDIVLKGLIAVFCIVFSSYGYVGYLRYFVTSRRDFPCNSLDTTGAVLVRGVTLIFPTLEVALVFLYARLICSKFQHLADGTAITIENLSDRHLRSSPSSEQSRMIYVLQQTPINNLDNLEQLSESHQEITSCLLEVNNCIGSQLLFGIAASLYTVIYYLYRYATSTDRGFSSNELERIHYVLGLIYRVGKMLMYVTLGQYVYKKSVEPLRVVQSSRLISLPVEVQQQVQTLLLQWNGKAGYLSAFGVIKVGPWLLAPIVGNVITYLLVALQFDDPTRDLAANVTAILESVL